MSAPPKQMLVHDEIGEGEMFGRAIRIEGGNPAVDDRRHAHLAAGLHREAVEQLIARQVGDHPPGREARRRRQFAWRGGVEGPEAAKVGVGDVDDGLVRREADAVRRNQVVPGADDPRAVGRGVIESAILATLRRRAAMVAEPEAALAIEHQIVGPNQPLAVARLVDGLDLAGGEIDALDHAADMARRGRPGDGQAALLEPDERAAVVGHPDRPVRPDRRPVRPAADLGHRGLACRPAAMRVRTPALISVTITEPSAMATGPSGNCRPSATTSMFIGDAPRLPAMPISLPRQRAPALGRRTRARRRGRRGAPRGSPHASRSRRAGGTKRRRPGRRPLR